MGNFFRVLGIGFFALQALILGCVSAPSFTKFAVPDGSLVADLNPNLPTTQLVAQAPEPDNEFEEAIRKELELPVSRKGKNYSLASLPRIVRSQNPEPTIRPLLAAPVSPPQFSSPSAGGPPSANTLAGKPPATSRPIEQTSLSSTMRNSKVMVRARVNGRPIFDDEVMQTIPPSAWREMQKMSETERAETMPKIFTETLDQIIDQELLYQDAVKKLEKGNPRALEKLKGLAEKEYDKQIKRILDANPGKEEMIIKEIGSTMKKQTERSFISMEYMRNMVFQSISRIGNEDVEDYYKKHINEFQKVETVEWQDVFIAVGKNHPTTAHARQFAQQLLDACKGGHDFSALLKYDEGDSKIREGLGLGTRRGEIRPAELEPYLFKMRPGEIGPPIELSTGIHLIRLVKRQEAGIIPLDEKVQTQIRNKLRNQLGEREYKRIVRELRVRSVVEVEKEGI